jgi:hypothetical protein
VKQADFIKRGADAAILALFASVPGGSSLLYDRMLLLPGKRLLSRTQMSDWLANAAKPMACIALEVRGMLAVGTWQGMRPSTIERDAELREMLDSTLAEAIRHRRQAPSRADIALGSNPQQSIEFTVAEFEQWLGEYDFPLADWHLGPTNGPVTGGALCELTFSPPAGGEMNTSL